MLIQKKMSEEEAEMATEVLWSGRRFVAVGLVARYHSPLFLPGLLLASLVNGRPLCNALIVTAPRDGRSLGQFQDAFDRFPVRP